ncbi:MAG: hypothetical protein C0436_00720 [Alphaproteobacteria bacterium]|nr:hypothetical protein [Alphaproteobacteria bacterium]
MRSFSLFKRSLAFLLMVAGCAAPQKQSPTMARPPMPGQNWVSHENSERWIAYYDKSAPAGYFKDYSLVVFDAEHHPAFSELQPKTEVLGYLSIGEVHGHSPHVTDLKAAGAIISRNPKWDSYIVDPRSKAWRELLLTKQIPAMVAAGFDGLMLDTIDSPLNVDSGKADEEAIYVASVTLIREIRTSFPNMKIMLNRGFEILDPVSGYIDYALAESTFSKYENDGKKPMIWDHSAQRPIVEMLRRAMRKNPQLKIYTLDYWDMNDVQGVQFVYQVQRLRGFIPYVATPDLRSTHAEPMLPSPEPQSLRG